MEVTLEVAFAVLSLFSVGVSELVEMLFTPTLKKYGVSDKELRKAIFIFGMVVVNAALTYWAGVDVIAGLLGQHTTIVTVALSAFWASGLGELYHGAKSRIRPHKNVADIAQDALDSVNEDF